MIIESFLNLIFAHFTYEVVQSSFTMILVIITGYYAWQTKKTVSLMQKAEKERNRPRIFVDIIQKDFSLNFIDITIVNDGLSVAKDIKFVSNSDFELNLIKKKFSEVMQFKKGIKNLIPKKEIIIPAFNLVESFEYFKNQNLQISVYYSDILGNKYKDEFYLDMSLLVERKIGKSLNERLVVGVEEIKKELCKVNKNLKKNYEKSL